MNTLGSPTYKLAKYLATLLRPLVGKTNSFVKDSTSWVQEIFDESLDTSDILVSFDVVSLYRKIPVDEAIAIIRDLTNDDVAKLVEVCLKSTFFTFQQIFHEQIESVAMGSPISLIVANVYMEIFLLHSSLWIHYVVLLVCFLSLQFAYMIGVLACY